MSIENKEIARGTFWLKNGTTHGVAKVMAEVDGWVMARFSGGIPFVEGHWQFLLDFTEAAGARTYKQASKVVSTEGR